MELYNLKSTGVIRRIDELGRIVIPKEIRRNLGIRDGENVEIFTESDSIILKKYNRLTTSSDLATSLCEIIGDAGFKIIITDNEKIIASNINNDLINKNLTTEYLSILEERVTKNQENTILQFDDITITGNFIFIPIISLNDSIGLIIMYHEYKLTNEEAIGKLASSIFSRRLDI